MPKTIKLIVTILILVIVGGSGFVAGFIHSKKLLNENELLMFSNLIFSKSTMANSVYKSGNRIIAKQLYSELLDTLTSKNGVYYSEIEKKPLYQYHIAFLYSRLAKIEKEMGNIEESKKYLDKSQKTLKDTNIDLKPDQKKYFDDLSSCLGEFYEY